ISRAIGAPVAWVPLDAVTTTLQVAGVTAGAPHPNAGRLFLDFITSRAGQEIFREANYIPMHPDVPAKDPAMKAEQGGYKSIVLSPEEIGRASCRERVGVWVETGSWKRKAVERRHLDRCSRSKRSEWARDDGW